VFNRDCAKVFFGKENLSVVYYTPWEFLKKTQKTHKKGTQFLGEKKRAKALRKKIFVSLIKSFKFLVKLIRALIVLTFAWFRSIEVRKKIHSF
jgi:hypothetical protein